MASVNQLEIFADYHQFYLQDERAAEYFEDEVEDDKFPPDDWGDRLVTDMIAMAVGTVGIGTARNMTVPVTVEVLPAPPRDTLDGWDHVAEASLDAPSGTLVVAGCTDYLPEAPRISVPAGSLRVRACYGGLDTLSEDGLDGDDNYRVVVWPAPPGSVEVLKRRPGHE